MEKENLPKINVAVLTYNHEEFIEECLDSIINQTYGNFDIIISDDCSSDGTYQKILDYDKKHPGYISKIMHSEQNMGISKNCNKLLGACEADYIAMFSGDDVMLPHKLEKQIKILHPKKNASLCYSNAEWFESKTGKKICNHNGFLQPQSSDLKTVIRDNCVPSVSMMLRRSLLPPGCYDETLPYINDFIFVIDLFLQGEVLFVKEPLMRYRRHDNNITCASHFADDRFMAVDKLKERFPGKDFVKPIKHFEAIAYYALIRERISQRRRMEAFKLLPKIFPYCFSSIKWLIRLGFIARDFIKPKRGLFND